MSPRKRRRTIDLGTIRAVKIGTPPPISDIYYATMEMSWPTFIALVSLVFVGINLLFGLLYAALPGALINAQPGSVADGFFFSVETLGTVGYGNMAPATHLGHLIAAAEILLGLFFSATITGLIFARFARPRTSFEFANVAVVGRRENQRLLMIRLASTRLRAIADCTAQLSWVRKITLNDGRSFRQLVDLPLVQSHHPQLVFNWTLVHEIDEASDMYQALLAGGEFRLTATISGIDTLLASQAIGGTSYRRKDILIDHEFDDMIDDSRETFEFDLTKLHGVHPRS
ncbi:inward rectifier potassium channel [Sphingomonas vulcanisoli]|uniref:Inward rectifier potassium channel n=1 Tax=Sphingomonas vulcanisoli TaxID=1658060 RepID=A0ABX0TS02_9SPHN|nr:ion channel [Sphingomonas vulcanisoli]NIJ08282.1 inward rectifier potassium channel [Sphingomonas vulcanisoli]